MQQEGEEGDKEGICTRRMHQAQLSRAASLVHESLATSSRELATCVCTLSRHRARTLPVEWWQAHQDRAALPCAGAPPRRRAPPSPAATQLPRRSPLHLHTTSRPSARRRTQGLRAMTCLPNSRPLSKRHPALHRCGACVPAAVTQQACLYICVLIAQYISTPLFTLSVCFYLYIYPGRARDRLVTVSRPLSIYPWRARASGWRLETVGSSVVCNRNQRLVT